MKLNFLLCTALLLLAIAGWAQNCTLPTNLQEGLVGYWPFCGNTNDESGNSLNGIVVGEPLPYLVQDRFEIPNSAFFFPDTQSIMVVPEPSLGTFSNGSLTFSFWIISEPATGNLQIIDFAGHRVQITSDSDRIIVLPYSGNTTDNIFEITSPILSNSIWKQVTVVLDQQDVLIYLNGTLHSTHTGNPEFPIIYSDGSFWLGMIGFETCPNLALDDIGIWNRALTAEEVALLYGNFTQPIAGCTSFDACNFDWLATIDDGSCAYNGDPCDDGDFFTMNDIIMNCFCGEIPVDIAAPHICGANYVHNPNLPYSIMTDQEGNAYRTILIGEQEWMAENLKTSTYRNGDTIPYVTDDSEWSTLNTGAYCFYNNDATFNCPFGKLYNWYTVVDSRNVCPVGWHVPTDDELSLLVNFLDPDADGGNNTNSSGGKMKSFGLQYWGYPNLSAANESGFSGLPGGARYPLGPSNSLNYGGYWWSSTEGNSNYAWARVLDSNNGSCHRWGPEFSKRFGFSVRCLRDNNTGLIPGCTDPLACNYEDTATIDNGSCLYPGFSCDDENILTENDTLDGACTCIGGFISGCTDPLASNYNPLATINEGCEYIVTLDTLICNQITTPTGPGQDWGLWLNGLYSAGLASTDWFRWSGFPSLVFSNDGSAHLVGDVVANNNLSNGWHVDITLEEGVDWSTWSAGGGLYMDNLGLIENTYTSWSFYKLVAGESRLEGFGALDGDLISLTHQPSNYAYGWQFGMGANNRNSNNGGSGWFFYSGIVNGTEASGYGDLTLDMACNYPESYSLNIFVYNDLNGNGTHDIDEPGLSNWPVMGNSIDGLLWTNNNGYYYLTLDTAQYEFTLLNTNDNWVSTTPMNVTIDLTSGPATASFGLQVVPGEAIIGASPFTGFWDILHCTQGYESGVYLENIGSQAVSGFMTLTCDPLFTPNADSYFTSPPVEVGPGYALWNVEDFQPGEYELLSFHIDGPGVEYLNQQFTFAFDLTLFDPQGNMIYNDNWSASPIVACAYDPNDITGFPEGLSAPHEEGYTIEHYILSDNMVEFRVRFQNTGTLPAEDIDIYIPLDPNQWDLSTIFPLMRSAEMQVVCLHDDGTVDLVLLEHELPEGATAQDLLIFSFDDIYLPDSASNPDGSQGYVYFRMQAKHTLNIGDEINAQAFIYFEQNPAVVTNETYHVIFDCTSFTPMVGDTELCAGEALQFSASQPNVDDYAWNIGSLEGSGNIFLFEGIDAGEYTLELNTSNPLCPQGEDHQVNVIVHDIPQLDVPLDATVCEGEELTYSAESDGTITWSNSANTGDTFAAEQSFSVTATAEGTAGCSTSADWTVTVNPLPSAEVDSANFVLTAADGVAWQWSVNGVLDATTQSINATENGNYQVEITSEFGCVAMSDVVAVELPIPDNVFVHSWSTLALFPNPMTTSARLELPQGAFDIALYDLTGACVRTMSKQQGTVVIERESLARGVYQVRISSGNDNRSIRLAIE